MSFDPVSEPTDLQLRALQRQGGRVQKHLVQVLRLVPGVELLGLREWPVGHHPLTEPGEHSRKRQEQEGDAHVEQGVGVGHLAWSIGGQPFHAGQVFGRRRDGAHQFGERRNEPDDEQHPDDLEGDVGHGHADRFPRLADGGKPGGGTGADVGAEGKRDAAFQGDQALRCEHDDDAHGRRR